MDPIIRIMLVVAVVGALCWVVITYVPMPQVFRQIILAAAAILTILWIVRQSGVF